MAQITKESTYRARRPDAAGEIAWTAAEHSVWHDLVQRQRETLPGRACDAYLQGLDRLQLPADRIPQLPAINCRLQDFTGWACEPVPALIDFDRFFRCLAHRRFPVATFVRRREELDYVQEPDIFHELFGHCAMLTFPAFAAFTQKFGEWGLRASKQVRPFLARLYWFTVEFGLLRQGGKTRIYGGGILSSPGETRRSLRSDLVEHRPFDLLEVLRTPYRIDVMQPIYFEIESLECLMDLTSLDMLAWLRKAQRAGLLPPRHGGPSETPC